MNEIARPVAIEVHGMAYRVKFLDVDEVFAAEFKNNGITDTEKCFIIIDGTLSPLRQAQVFQEEVIHAIVSEYAIRNDGGAMTEEDWAGRLGPALAVFWKKNPMALTWFARALSSA